MGLLALLLATGAHGQATRKGARSAAAERAVLAWADAEVAAGRADHAARGVLRAARRTPTAALLTQYARVALPCTLPKERERPRLQRAASNLLTTIDAASKQEPPLQLTSELGVFAGWALTLVGEPARSREVTGSFGARDDATTLACLRSSAAWLLAKGDTGEAQAVLTLARGFAPTDAGLASELGLSLLASGDARRALVPLAERFAIEPASLSARRDFAYGLLAAGRATEGYQLLAVAADTCRALDGCLLELARAALEARRPREAEAHARALLKRHVGSLPALFLIAEAQGQQADADGARATYLRVLELAPSNLRAKAALGEPAPP